jgi:hypothetical protein
MLLLLAPGKFFISLFFFFSKENFPGSEKKKKFLYSCLLLAPVKFFIKTFFFTSWGSFPYKNKTSFFFEKFAGHQQY